MYIFFNGIKWREYRENLGTNNDLGVWTVSSVTYDRVDLYLPEPRQSLPGIFFDLAKVFDTVSIPPKKQSISNSKGRDFTIPQGCILFINDITKAD